MINLSTKLASKGFTITFVQTEFIHHSISKAHHHHLLSADFDIFTEARKSGLDIRYTTISDGFPLDFDRHLNGDLFWETMFRDFPDRVDEVVARTMKDEEESCFFIIADTLCSWPATIAKKYNMVNVSLWTAPATVFSINYHLDLLKQNGHFPFTGDGENHINYIPGVQSISTRDLMSYIQHPNIKPVLVQITLKGFDQEPLAESDCTGWLHSKPPGSVLYVSFGSFAQSNKQLTAELAHGLLSSEVHFVWIIRPDVVGENGIDDILPIGFEDVIKDRGLIVPWCNQNRVLSSPAIGGFLTHCGWNSIMESIWHGVPMICYPFYVDQPTNRKLVVDDWKIGINLCEGERVTREEVASKINVVMNGEKSAELKREIKKVSEKLHDSLGSGGSSERNFNRFVDDLKAKLCEKQK
ncbi:hypothetical protein DH2020_004935 [Rehmannia glutinosa]|uniref:Glycosyltransferase n=1 Tax=Rehmannia glutinosa TaxID=99300 RepID=A0ABR0XQW4_REHGL